MTRVAGRCHKWPRSAAALRRFWAALAFRLIHGGSPHSETTISLTIADSALGGRPAVEKLEAFRGGHLKGALCTPHVPV